MVYAVRIIDGGSGNVDVQVFRDAVNGKTVNLNSLRSLLTGSQRNNPAIVSARATDFLQMLLDDRTLLTDLPADDPARITDPALPHWFHAREADSFGQGQNLVRVYRPIALVGGTATHIIGRETLVTVTWNGTIGPNSVDLTTASPPLMVLR